MKNSPIDIFDFFLKKVGMYEKFYKRLAKEGLNRNYLGILPINGIIILSFKFEEGESEEWLNLHKEWERTINNKT